MKCHARQGYKVGDVRGGISVSVPWTSYRERLRSDQIAHGLGYGAIWIIGIIGLVFGKTQLQSERKQTEEALRERTKELQCLHAVSTLERRHAQDAQQESEKIFATFLRLTPVYVYIKEVSSTESRVLRASDNFQQMIGISGADMVGKTMAELFPPELAAKISADDWSVVSKGEAVTLEEELNGRSYTTIKFPIALEGRSLLAGYTIDVTERKRAEETLRQQSAELRIFDTAGVDRELVMIGLKQQVNALSRQLGQAAPYDVDFADAPPKDQL